jgi:hypothetical protein
MPVKDVTGVTLEKEVKSIDPPKRCYWCRDEIKDNPFLLQRDREHDYQQHCAECVVEALLLAIKHGWKITNPAVYKIKIERK